MKIIFLILSICFAFPSSSNAQTTTYEWAKSMGGPSSDNSTEITTDLNGNVYTTGSFYDTVDFDPNAGVSDLISNGSRDIFVQKLDPSGNLLWVNQIGGTGSDLAESITTDASGNVYTVGMFAWTVDFDPGPDSTFVTSLGSQSCFIHKVSPNGDLIWVKQIGAVGSSTAYGKNITVDVFGNIFIAGDFRYSPDFDPGIGVSTLTSYGDYDLFVEKFDSNGNMLWVKQMGGLDTEHLKSLTTDANGNVLTTGYFEGTVDYDPSVGVTNLTSFGNYDAFIQKLDSAGNLTWAVQMGSNNNAYGEGIVTDPVGNIYSTGGFIGTADFDPGVGVSNLTASGNSDIYIQKLDVNGNLIWVKQMGGSNSDSGFDIDSDTSGNIFTTGHFNGNVDFNPNPGSTILSSNGASDVFIQKLDSSGNLKWAKSVGGSSFERGLSINVDVSENVFTTGYLQGLGDYDPNIGVANLTSNGSNDIFVLKLNQCQTTYNIDTQTACGSYTWTDGITYTSSNNSATQSLFSSIGCDSVVTLDLIINYPNAGTDIQSACDSFTWIDGITYTSSNNSATQTLTNISGCDSLVTLDLMINSNTGTDVQSACNSYTWLDGNTYNTSNNTATWTLTNSAGCDSVVTLNLFINYSNAGTDVQIACESYTWLDGITYTSDINTPTWTLSNANGCDSIVTLDLIINPVPDINVTQAGTLLMADQTGANYQWLNCDNNYSMIVGEVNQTYAPTSITGNYAVLLDLDGCTDTSACFLVDYSGLSELYQDKLSIYPNPVEGQLTIKGLEEVVGLIRIELVSSIGKLESTITPPINGINTSELTTGVYLIKIVHAHGIEAMRFIKK